MIWIVPLHIPFRDNILHQLRRHGYKTVSDISMLKPPQSPNTHRSVFSVLQCINESNPEQDSSSSPRNNNEFLPRVTQTRLQLRQLEPKLGPVQEFHDVCEHPYVGNKNKNSTQVSSSRADTTSIDHIMGHVYTSTSVLPPPHAIWRHHSSPTEPPAVGALDLSQDTTRWINAIVDPQHHTVQRVFQNALQIAGTYSMPYYRPRSPRQRVYWKPGGNAGMPMISKSTKAHESAFAFHDLMHVLMPDSLLAGGVHEDSEWEQHVYAVTRTMSETITLGLTDCLYVMCLLQDGVAYETVDERKVQPMFRHICHQQKWNSPEDVDLQRLLKAFAFYGIGGDDSYLRGLCGASTTTATVKDDVPPAVTSFRKKYDAYFAEDFRWSRGNAGYMSGEPQQMWFRDAKDVVKQATFLRLRNAERSEQVMPYMFPQVEDVMIKLRQNRTITQSDVIHIVFKHLWETYLQPAFAQHQQQQLLSFEEKLSLRFIRWARDQMKLCYDLESVHPRLTSVWKEVLWGYVMDNNPTQFRKAYNAMLTECVKHRVLNADSCLTYAHTYMNFEASYVYYNRNQPNFESDCQRYVDDVVRGAQRWATYKGRYETLLRAAGGELMQPGWVKRPGVTILAETAVTEQGRACLADVHLEDKKDHLLIADAVSRITYLSFPVKRSTDSTPFVNKILREHGHWSVVGGYHVTLLIVGISIEIVLELVAHREAHVGRLTTSNTHAMDDPHYRVLPGLDPIATDDNSSTHSMTHEYRNMTRPGNKAGGLIMTMSLKDWHRTVSGRMAPEGNESELRELCEQIVEVLHVRYPEVIGPVASYRTQK